MQCFLTACAVCVVLLLLNTMSDTVIIAALGASSFVVFTMPGVQASKPRSSPTPSTLLPPAWPWGLY